MAGTSYFVHTVAPGASWTSVVAVVNTGDTAINAWVDPVDGVTSVRTGAVYAARTVPAAGTGVWIKSSVSSVSVAAHRQTEIAFTVTVPLGASAGDHVGGIAFESKHGSSSGGTAAITTVLRSVVAVQVRVPGPATFQLSVYRGTITAISTTGTAAIAVDMANVGGLLDKPHLEIALDGPGGYHRAASFQLDTMLPSDRITDEFVWPDALPVGDYRLAVTEDGSGRHGITFVTSARVIADLRPAAPSQLPEIATAAPPPYQSTWVLFALPAGGAAIGILAVLLFIARRHPLRRS